MLTGKHLINGQWQAESPRTFHAVNPSTGIELPPAFHEATEAEVEAAMTAAMAAFDASDRLSPEDRASLLEAVADELESLGDDLVNRASAESALPVDPRLKGELGRTTGQLRMFAGVVRDGSWVDAVIDTADPGRKPAPKPDLRRMRRPLGPVAVFDASNFPLAFGPCGGDTASALAAGCPVIVKSHPAHPGSGELAAQAVHNALSRLDLPMGMFQLLQSEDHAVSRLLVCHPATAAVGFTGSLRAGRALFDLAASRDQPIPVFAEMGSVNPLVVLPAALAEKGDAIASGLAGSVCMSAGQMCTKPGLIFALGDREQLDGFTRAVSGAVAGAGSFTLLNPQIAKAFRNGAARWGQHPDVDVLVDQATEDGASTVGPVLIRITAEAWRQSPELHEELFGPAAVIVTCENRDDLLMALESLTGNLTGSIHMGEQEDADLLDVVARRLEARVGRLVYNGYPTGVEVGGPMQHGGPYPATTAPGTTSVGTAAILRFSRPVAFQNAPQASLPDALKDANPLGIRRTVNGRLTDQPV